ncbi:MAG: DUF952 domain-containing protein [Aliishimia sp.]
MIYKIFRPDEWADLQANGTSSGAPIDVSDGYIHFSTAAQAPETAAKHFAGAQGLILVLVDETLLGDALKWEVSRGNAKFPHLYRDLTMTDVISAHTIGYQNGTHVFPVGME